VLNDQSGLYAGFGGLSSVVAARMAIEDFGSTVLGRTVEILSADHQNKPDLGSAIARKWFDADGVTAIADLTNSAVALSVQKLARDRERIALFSGPATTRLTNEDCSPFGFQWVFDTYSLAKGTGRAILKEGGNSWFLLVADYAYGHQMAADLTRLVTANGGKVVGVANHPTGSTDFSSYLVSAQSSSAKIIGLANGGRDTVNAVKQAAEFGLIESGQRVVALGIVISDVHALGLDAAKGLLATTAFYWDRDQESRDWSKRFYATTHRMPGMIQAGVYSSVFHYLEAVQAAGTTDGKAVAAKMRELPVNDFFAKNAELRADGRLAKEMYLVEVKAPNDSKGPWDYYRILRTILVEDAVMPLSESKCDLVKH